MLSLGHVPQEHLGAHPPGLRRPVGSHQQVPCSWLHPTPCVLHAQEDYLSLRPKRSVMLSRHSVVSAQVSALIPPGLRLWRLGPKVGGVLTPLPSLPVGLDPQAYCSASALNTATPAQGRSPCTIPFCLPVGLCWRPPIPPAGGPA